jgi:hypothetical protein
MTDAPASPPLFLPKMAAVENLPAAVVQVFATVPALNTWPPGLVVVVVGGDLLYGAGPCPKFWHYIYKYETMHQELGVSRVLPAVCTTDTGVVAVFGCVLASFRCLALQPELHGIWTRNNGR